MSRPSLMVRALANGTPLRATATTRQFLTAARRAEMPSPEPLMTLEHVRIKLALKTIAAVRKHIQRNGLPVRLVGQTYRVDPRELEAWTKRGRR